MFSAHHTQADGFAVSAAKGNRYNFMVVFFAALGSFTYGFNSAIVGTVFGLPSFFDYFNISLTGPNATKGNQYIGGGGLIGSLCLHWLINKYGRRPIIQVLCVVAVISAILQGAAVHIAMFLVGRFFNGLGVGAIDVAVPLYQSELSPAKQRGRMVGSHGFLVVCGYAGAGWTGLWCYFVKDPSIQWRVCLTLQVVAPALLLIGSPWLPESPRWLASKGRNNEALEILRRLHTGGAHDSDMAAREEFYQISKQIELESTGNTTMWGMFLKPSYRKRVLTGMFVQFLAQSTGVLVVNNYLILLLQNLGLSGWVPLLLYAVYDSWAAFMNFINSLLLDRIGRVRILTIGLIGCGVMMILETAMVANFAGSNNRAGNAMGVLFLYLFVTFYGGSLDAGSYVYCAEIFPTSIRAQGLGMSVASLFASTLLYTEVAPTAFQKIGWKYYLVFIIVPLVGVGFLAMLAPETKNLTLEEIAAKFGDAVAVDISHLSEEQRRRLDERLAATDDGLVLAGDEADGQKVDIAHSEKHA
ncbi:hypothetical protein LTR10_013538 [Elasticomyces elasticus]|uniref:Major facilitator superfamily (MFS) profile domain-containing protein n=1 Tax=Exophiala sideris TaxID=1016849 RepID=A0ABR0JQ23_9EURO|nr:hypothetical protein LTR10_013538 [Elasticomyces elasticus]KAK5039676.1 hypothetical protein LTS07_000171 [Exophiala sideris]KAK5041228.1 hypothetical protein LTR13_002703 [Exophiala sideris]KAK5068053.1 hypothetical protein LTR69_000171 [Exophiala sideris]KAK5187355.1 hypothetical protein LTR44_000171 [Eurotiomycetes sp. CCFEE 6388]